MIQLTEREKGRKIFINYGNIDALEPVDGQPSRIIGEPAEDDFTRISFASGKLTFVKEAAEKINNLIDADKQQTKK